MPPFRMPFTSKKPPFTNGVDATSDENSRPDSNGADASSPYKDRPSLALSIKGTQEQPNEFKMSAVNDSGEYLPPSPPEKKSFWSKSAHSTNSSNHRIATNDNEPFSISRESFESYRRSFDISGRSPILASESYTSRTSLDSRQFRPLPRSLIGHHTFERPPTTAEEGFEDVGLNDDPKPKKRHFLSRFGAESENPAPTTEGKPMSSLHHFHIPGRKRGQSGTGAELGNMERPSSKGKADVPVH